MQGELSTWARAVMPFFKWNADFEVSFDQGVSNGTVFLDGQYDGAAKWGFKTWVGAAFKDDLEAGGEIRLLKQGYQEVYLNYAEICTNVIQFKCGAMNLSPANWGTTMRVDLRLYENTGRCNETKSAFTVDTYEYAFKGPLNIKYYSNDVEIASLTTNHDGRTEFPLLAYQTGNPTLAFTGWTNENGVAVKVIPRMIREVSDENPIKTWYAGGEDTLKLYATFKEAKTMAVTVKPTGETPPVASDIKVTKDWIKENVGEDATDEQILKALNETKESEGGKIPVWQTYVLGLDSPSGNVSVVATEKLDNDKVLVISTVQAPPPDSGFKVTYSLDKINKDTDEPIDEAHKGVQQETKDISIDLEPQSGEVPTGYYKMNVFITPEVDGEVKKEEQVQVKSEVTVGVLTVKTEEPVVPVAIPWTSLAGKGDDANAMIPADEIVQPQGLSEGDELFVYNREGEVYTTLTLQGGKWVADGQTIPVDDGGDAGEATQPGEVPMIERGYGMWLKRQNPTSAFHLFGQYNTTDASTKIEKPAPEKETPEYNLIAPTGIEDTDLNAIPSLAPGVGGKNDKLMIVESGVPTYYDYKNGSGWGYDKQIIKVTASGKKRISTQRVNEAKVPAGVGLWYISAGGEPTINWSERTSSAQ